MKLFNFIFIIAVLLGVVTVEAHHYKGLPHYSYFENYPQVPVLEFINETPEYEIFMTVYNFQGLNLEQVESPDDVRLYIYIFDLKQNKVFKGQARFKILSRGQLVYDTKLIDSEQENIFVIQRKIENQDDLFINVEFKDQSGQTVTLEIPFQITKSFFQKYGVYLLIVLFFIIVSSIKVISGKWMKSSQNEKGGGIARHA